MMMSKGLTVPDANCEEGAGNGLTKAFDVVVGERTVD